MGLTNVTGLLSRYFAVGFFLPAYFALVLLWIAASRGFIPNSFESYKGATQVLVLGGLALLAALALSGLNHSIFRLFENYPLEYARKYPLLGALYRHRLDAQRRKFNGLMASRWGDDVTSHERGNAAWRLDQLFPEDPERLLPTSFGNAIKAFEQHSRRRYGLNGIGAWPRIEMLMSADAREPLVDSKIDVNVFMNAALSACLVGIALLCDLALNTPIPYYLWWLYLFPFGVASILYRPMVGAAVRWGEEVRAAIDLHRLEFYGKLGLRRPTSFTDERALASKLNQTLIFGLPLPDDLWREDEPTETAVTNSSGPVRNAGAAGSRHSLTPAVREEHNDQ